MSNPASFGHIVNVNQTGRYLRIEWSNGLSLYINDNHVDYQFTGPEAASRAAEYHAVMVGEGRGDAILNPPVEGKANLVRVPR